MKKTCLLAIISLALASSLQAGDISGTVTLKGTPPAEKKFEKKTDPNCGSPEGSTHHYIVGSKGELANAIVSLKGVTGKSTGSSAAPAMMDQKGCEYSPTILAVQTGQKIVVKNSDQTLHNVHTVPGAGAGNKEINQAQGPNAPDLTYVASTPENFLMFKCEVHPWMFAWVSVFDHPYFAVTDKDGKYTIKDVPDGKYTLQVMHRKAAPAASAVTKEVEVKGGNITEDIALDAK